MSVDSNLNTQTHIEHMSNIYGLDQIVVCTIRLDMVPKNPKL